MSAPDWIEVDGKTDVIRNQQQLNHPAALQEIRRIADRERVGISKCREILIHPFFFRGAEIGNRTLPRVRLIKIGLVEVRLVEANNPHRTPVNFFTRGNAVESAAKWIIPNDTNIEAIGIGYCAWRDAHKLAEVEQVGGLYRVLGRLGLGGEQHRGG